MDANIEEQLVPSFSPDTVSWIGSLIRLGRQVSEQNGQLVVVVIARKMARLMEYHIKNKSSVELSDMFSFKKETEHFPIITEHAIPFYFDNYKALANRGLNLKRTQIVIVDDLMVYGDTVETVSESIYAQTGIKPFIIAMASTKKLESNFKYANIIEPLNRLEDNELSSFTAKCSRDILSLKSSIDIEHTILKIPLDSSDIYIPRIKEHLEKYLRMTFPSALVYTIRHDIPETNGNENRVHEEAMSITVYFANDSENLNNDFNKIRFFICDNELRIVSYAPNIWIESDLNNTTFDFLSPGLNQCWGIIKSHLDSLEYMQHDSEDSLTNYKLSQSLNKRKTLSKVVWSNYLCSFENILKYKTKIIDVIKSIISIDPKIEICEEALNLIIGPSMSEIVLPLLKQELDDMFYKIKKPYTRWMQEAEKSEPLIPSSDKDVYLQEINNRVISAPNLSTSLSLIFDYLHKKYGLINNRYQEDKIKVGETFESLSKTLSSEYSSNELLLEIHRWIDERIDLGIVVPKYEQIPISLGNYAWRRFFRAGEREDFLLDIAYLAQWLKKTRIENKKWEKEENQSYNSQNCKWLQDRLSRYNDLYPNQVQLKAFGESPNRIIESKIVNNLPITVLRFYMDIIETLKNEDKALESYTGTALFK